MNGNFFLKGENDIEQLAIVVHSLGTPTLEIWPSVERLPDYNKITFAPSAGKPFQQLIPDVDDSCLLDLIKSFLHYEGKKRSTAKKVGLLTADLPFLGVPLSVALQISTHAWRIGTLLTMTVVSQALSHPYFFNRPLPIAERSMPVQTYNHRNAIRNQLQRTNADDANPNAVAHSQTNGAASSYHSYFDTMYSFLKHQPSQQDFLPT